MTLTGLAGAAALALWRVIIRPRAIRQNAEEDAGTKAAATEGAGYASLGQLIEMQRQHIGAVNAELVAQREASRSERQKLIAESMAMQEEISKLRERVAKLELENTVMRTELRRAGLDSVFAELPR